MTEQTEKKIIAVMGATGAQGGAVVDALLTVPEQFAIRAITRNPESEKAKALIAKGCEVVKADADDVPSMVAAFSGAYGAFLGEPSQTTSLHWIQPPQSWRFVSPRNFLAGCFRVDTHVHSPSFLFSDAQSALNSSHQLLGIL